MDDAWQYIYVYAHARTRTHVRPSASRHERPLPDITRHDTGVRWAEAAGRQQEGKRMGRRARPDPPGALTTAARYSNITHTRGD